MASLIYHAGALGDFITTLPAVRAWRPAAPGGSRPPRESPRSPRSARPAVRRDLGRAARDCSRPCSRGSERLEPAACETLRRFDPRSLFRVPAHRCRAAPARAGCEGNRPPGPFPSDRTPDRRLSLSLFPGPVQPMTKRIPRVRSSPLMRREPPAPVVLHPGKRELQRRTGRMERFLGAARWLADGESSVAWILGPAEEAGLASRTGTRVWRACPCRRLRRAWRAAGCSSATIPGSRTCGGQLVVRRSRCSATAIRASGRRAESAIVRDHVAIRAMSGSGLQGRFERMSGFFWKRSDRRVSGPPRPVRRSPQATRDCRCSEKRRGEGGSLSLPAREELFPTSSSPTSWRASWRFFAGFLATFLAGLLHSSLQPRLPLSSH